MAMQSNTGTAQTYEAGDQRTFQSNEPETYKPHVHEVAHDIHDSKDSRSLRNRAADEKALESKEQQKAEHERLHKQDPTAPAREHGNKPSRGAVVDAELKRDDELRMQEKEY